MTNNKPNPIARLWLDFAKNTLPGLSPGMPQYEDMRKSFYCGAIGMFELSGAIGSPVVPPQAIELFADATRIEINEFVEELRRKSLNDIANRN